MNDKLRRNRQEIVNELNIFLEENGMFSKVNYFFLNNGIFIFKFAFILSKDIDKLRHVNLQDSDAILPQNTDGSRLNNGLTFNFFDFMMM